MLEMLHNLNLSKMFMTENITTEALNIVFFNLRTSHCIALLWPGNHRWIT